MAGLISCNLNVNVYGRFDLTRFEAFVAKLIFLKFKNVQLALNDQKIVSKAYCLWIQTQIRLNKPQMQNSWISTL